MNVELIRSYSSKVKQPEIAKIRENCLALIDN